MGRHELTVGSSAPAFEAADQQGNRINLAQTLEGANGVLLIFYPGDMTPGCTMQLCAIRDDWSKFADAGIRVFGINPASAGSHKAFAEKHHFPFPLLVDEGQRIAKAYHTLQNLLIVKIIQRTVVGINKEGTVVYYRRGLPKNSEIFKAFKL